MKQIIIMALMVTCLSSCFQQYYKTNTTSKIESVMFEQFQKQNKVFIMHTPEGPFLLRDIKLDKDVLTGEKTPLNSNYDRYLNPDTTGANRYPKKEKDIALSEVHIYTNSSFDGKTEVNLAMNQIFRLDVYDKDMKAIRGRMDVYCSDKSASRSIRILSSVGFSFGIVVIAGGSFLIAKGAGLSLL